MKTRVRRLREPNGVRYIALMFVCPGCVSAASEGYQGVHMLAVNSPQYKPSWDWNGDLVKPTLTPSIKTTGGYVEDGKYDDKAICHSFLTDGIFKFLNDSTHPMAGQEVPIPDLPEWVEGLS